MKRSFRWLKWIMRMALCSSVVNIIKGIRFYEPQRHNAADAATKENVNTLHLSSRFKKVLFLRDMSVFFLLNKNRCLFNEEQTAIFIGA
jgi:hypothetical protein